MPNEQDRKNLIAKIHVGKNQLQMNDDSYRALLYRMTGKTSCVQMNREQLEAVFFELRRLGFAPKSAKKGKKPNVSNHKIAMLGKIEAILADLRLPWVYAEGMARKMFGREKIEWLNGEETRKLLQALIIFQNRQVAKEMK